MEKINIQHVIDNARFNTFHFNIVLWCFLIIIFDVYDLIIYGVVLPVLMDQWNLTAVEAGTLGSYALFGMMFGAIIFGSLSDRIGRITCIAICLALFGVFTLLVTTTDNITLFGIFRFLTGLGVGGLMPNAVALTSEYAPKKMRALLTTIMFSGYGVGGILASGLGMWLVPEFGWKSMFYIGGLPLLAIPLVFKFMPESPGFLLNKGLLRKLASILNKVDTENHYAEDYVYTLPEKVPGTSVVQLFKNNRGFSTLMFWTAFFMCLLMVYGLSSWLPKLMHKAGYPLGSSISFLLALNIGAIIGAIGGGWLGDKFHLKKVSVIFFSIAVASMVLLGFKSSTFMLYLLLGTAGATIIGTQILLYAYVAQFYPMDIRSTGIGWSSGVGRIGGIIGPILGGVLLSWDLSIQANFAALAIPGAIAAISVGLISRKHAYTAKT